MTALVLKHILANGIEHASQCDNPQACMKQDNQIDYMPENPQDLYEPGTIDPQHLAPEKPDKTKRLRLADVLTDVLDKPGKSDSPLPGTDKEYVSALDSPRQKKQKEKPEERAVKVKRTYTKTGIPKVQSQTVWLKEKDNTIMSRKQEGLQHHSNIKGMRFDTIFEAISVSALKCSDPSCGFIFLTTLPAKSIGKTCPFCGIGKLRKIGVLRI